MLTLKVLADRARKELGIPCFFPEGRNLDRAAFEKEKFKETLEGWVDICLSRKAGG